MAATEPIACVSGLSKRFGKKTVLERITAAAAPGDVIGVLGKNGAGKTTLLEVLLGFSPPSEGTARVLGENSFELSEQAKARIGFVPQQDELLEPLTAAQQIDIISSFHRQWDRALTARLVGEWGIPLRQRVQTLSLGERQKLSLVLALGHHPDLLVLDEPVASLDPIARRQFLRQILDASDNPARTVLFSSHIVSDLERAANKVWILDEGRLLWQSPLDALKESVVRLHVRARRELPPDLGIAHALSVRMRGRQATVAVARWEPSKLDALAARLDADIEVEPLTLEDIFVELLA